MWWTLFHVRIYVWVDLKLWSSCIAFIIYFTIYELLRFCLHKCSSQPYQHWLLFIFNIVIICTSSVKWNIFIMFFSHLCFYELPVALVIFCLGHLNLLIERSSLYIKTLTLDLQIFFHNFLFFLQYFLWWHFFLQKFYIFPVSNLPSIYLQLLGLELCLESVSKL